jgi:predicted PurR-regulated permease PerM
MHPLACADLAASVGAAVLAAIIFGTLYFGREVFIPIALAILLSFVLAPIVRQLQRLHVPRGFSVVGVVLLAFLVIFISWWADRDPTHRARR